MGGDLDCGEQKPAQAPQSGASVQSPPAVQSVSTSQPVTQATSPKGATNNKVKLSSDRPAATGANLSKTSGDLGATNDGLTATNRALQATSNASAALTNDVGNGTIGLVRQADTSAAVTVAAKTGGRLVDRTGGDGSRTLRGITNGTVSAQSSDALTGQQLYRSADSVATWLGGGSHVNQDGTVSQPSYAVLGSIYHDVASALNAASVNSIQYDVSAEGHRLNSVTLQGGSPGTVALHNVAAGTAANDATNLKQLNDGLAMLGAEDRLYTDRKVAEVDRHARAAGSAAIAAAGLAFSDEAKGDRSVAIAIGTFRDSVSLAGGLAYRMSDAVRVKANVSYTPDTGDVGGSVSLGVKF